MGNDNIVWMMRLLVFWLLLAGAVLVEPALAQGGNGITSPGPGDTVSGIVIVEGTATDPSFLRYELAFLQEFNPGAGWIVFAEGDRPVVGGTLAVWDTTVGHNVNAPVFPDGLYQLRLRVVRSDYNYNEYFAGGIQVSNEGPTPTPTEAEPAGAAATATPGQGGPVATLAAPGILPSLTPFPTPSRQATPASEVANVDGDGPPAEPRQGLAGRLAEIEVSRFGRAFSRGVMISAYLFAVLALYLLVRAIWRRAWRLIASRIVR